MLRLSYLFRAVIFKERLRSTRLPPSIGRKRPTRDRSRMLSSRRFSQMCRLTLFPVFVVAGCASLPPAADLPGRAYDGPARSAASVAVIEHTDYDYVVGGWRTEIESIDGEAVHPHRVEVLPGQRTVSFGGKICLAGVCSGTVPASITFEAQAGARYRVDCDYWLSEMTLVHAESGRVIVRLHCDDNGCQPSNS